MLLPNCLKLRSSLGRTEEKRQTVTYDSVTGNFTACTGRETVASSPTDLWIFDF